MPYRRRICLIALFLVVPSWQPMYSGLTHAQGVPQGQPRQQAKTDKAQPAHEKEPDYSQEALVIEQLKRFYRFEKDGTGQREQSLRAKV